MLRETLFEINFNMKKADSHFSNKYLNLEVFVENGITYTFLSGRWTSNDDKKLKIPNGYSFVECVFNNDNVYIRFKNGDVPLEVMYTLTNRKKRNKV